MSDVRMKLRVHLLNVATRPGSANKDEIFMRTSDILALSILRLNDLNVKTKMFGLYSYSLRVVCSLSSFVLLRIYRYSQR